MNTKQKLGYMFVGGALVAVGMAVAVLVVSPVVAQIKGFSLPEGLDKFDTIQCSRLEVVDVAGKARVVLTIGDDGGLVYAIPKDGEELRRSILMNTAGVSLPLARMALR